MIITTLWYYVIRLAAAGGGGVELDRCALAELSAGLPVDGLRLFLHLGVNVLGDGAENLLDVVGTLGGGLQEGNAVVLGELSAQFEGHLALGLSVALVSHDQLAHALVRQFIYLDHPGLDVLEGVLVCHVVDDNDPVRASVVAAGESSESLLTSCVPLQIGWLRHYDLQLDAQVVESSRFNLLHA